MKTKTIIALFVMMYATVAVAAQRGVAEVLDELAATIKSYQCLYFEYTMTIADRHLHTSEMKDGKIIMKGNKFRLSTVDVDIYSDGATQWQYLKSDNELMISLADSTADIVSNPVGFIMGDKKDFKQLLKGEVVEDGFDLIEIDFYPWNIKMPYSCIRIRIDDRKHRPYSVKYIGKDGVDYIIKIKNYAPNIELPDDGEFVFDPSKYPDIEIVDLRE
jgi:outer membrane lipoprotein-sorting protein